MAGKPSGKDMTGAIFSASPRRPLPPDGGSLHAAVDGKLWLREGFLLQTAEDSFLLGQGPLRRAAQPAGGLYHPDFFLREPKPWLIPRALWKTDSRGLKAFLSGFSDRRPPPSEISRPSFAAFQQVFCASQRLIKSGALQKTVPVFCEAMRGRPHLPGLLKRLFQNAQKSPRSGGFLYGAWIGDSGIAGKTPEILFSLRGREVFSMALAGTAPHPGPPLLQDEKEMREHLLAAESIKTALKGLVSWKSFRRFERPFPPLKHICSEMRGGLAAPFDFSLFCQRLHPTGALGGSPPKKAFAWLKREPSQQSRRFFGAPFGFFDGKSRAFCLAAIRGLEWSGSETRLYSGAGIVKGSILQNEWRELSLKREQVKGFFRDLRYA